MTSTSSMDLYRYRELSDRLTQARGQQAYYASRCNNAMFQRRDDEADYYKWKAVVESLEQQINEEP